MEGCDRPSKEVKGHFCSIGLTLKVIRHRWNVQVYLYSFSCFSWWEWRI